MNTRSLADKEWRNPTIRDIADQARVSTWTVSQVLRNQSASRVAQATRSRILGIASELGYRPNHAARALVSSKTSIVAIWLRTHVEFSTYYGRLQHCLQRLAGVNGYQCITEHVPLDDVANPEFSRLMSWPMDGVIACDVSGPVAAYVAAYRNRVPIVNLGAWPVESTDYVSIDLAAGATQAVKHLLDEGCDRIAFVGRLPIDMRGEAYKAVMKDAQKTPTYVITPADTRQSSRASLLDYARSYSMPNGLFCANDDIAIGCFRALRELGLRVPEDVRIVGCDGLEEAELLATPLSTIAVPVDQVCDQAWKFLENRMKDPNIPQQTRTIKPELVVRESSRLTPS